MATPRMDSFTRAYFEAALWASSDESDDQGGEPLDKNYDISDFDPATRDKMIADCADFQERFADPLLESGLDDEKAGHDFWLSRNGHGSGFFDEEVPRRDELQDAAESYGEFYLYVGDPDEDGERLIYGPPPGAYGVREARGAHARASRVAAAGGRWSVEPGRQIYFSGYPIISINREGDATPVIADGATRLIAELFNQNEVTPDDIYKKHMGTAHRRAKRYARRQ